MTEDEIKRLYYYNRQYLGFKDFQDEQKYHMDMRRRHNIGHHIWGIVTGLELVYKETFLGSNIYETYIRPGMAVDGCGREIIVFQPVKIEPADVAAKNLTPGIHRIWLNFHQQKITPPEEGYEICTPEKQYTRMQETFKVIIGMAPGYPYNTHSPYKSMPDDPKLFPWPVPIGKIAWDGSKIIGADFRGRKYFGVVGEEIRTPLNDMRITSNGKPLLTVHGPEERSYIEISQSADGTKRGALFGDWGGLGSDLQSKENKDLYINYADNRGHVHIGGQGTHDLVVNGNLIVKDGSKRKVMYLDRDHAVLYVGNKDNEGDLVVKDGNGKNVFLMDGSDAALYIGANGNEGDIIVRDSSGGTAASIDGNTGTLKIKKINAGHAVNQALDIEARYVRIHGWDLMLDGRSGGNKRALVDLDNKLVINFNNDYSDGVQINGLSKNIKFFSGSATPFAVLGYFYLTLVHSERTHFQVHTWMSFKAIDTGTGFFGSGSNITWEVSDTSQNNSTTFRVSGSGISNFVVQAHALCIRK